MVLSSKDFVSPINLVATTAAFFDNRIDLDPASSDNANKVVQAERFFNWEQNGLLQEWKANTVYLYPPRDYLLHSEQPKNTILFEKQYKFKKSSQRVWLEVAYKKWIKREFDEAIVFLTSTEVALLITQKLNIDTPICVLKEKPKLLWDEKDLTPLKNTKVYGFVLYFPGLDNTDKKIGNFIDFYSSLGRVYH